MLSTIILSIITLCRDSYENLIDPLFEYTSHPRYNSTLKSYDIITPYLVEYLYLDTTKQGGNNFGKLGNEVST